MGAKNEGKPSFRPNPPNRFRDPRLTAARCGKSKPRPGTPLIVLKLGLRGVPTSGERGPLLTPPARPGPEIPRADPEKLRTGAEDPRMGAENQRAWPEADIATPKPRATRSPSLCIPLTIEDALHM